MLEDAGNTIGFGEQCRIDDSEAETGGKSVFVVVGKDVNYALNRRP